MASATPATDEPDPPSPDGGWSGEIVTLKNALLCPPTTSELVQQCGVLTADGGFCKHAATWRGKRQMMTPPEGPVTAVGKLPGTHLFAGQLWAHFGHYMAESLSRFWALDHLKTKPDSILFLPKRPADEFRMKGYQKEFLDLLGIDLPVQVITTPTEVETLIVPGQGFGLGEISSGTKKFRDYFAKNFAPDIKPAGDKKIYLSRTALGGLEGGAILEDLLEQNLASSGYHIVHPQKHTIAEQVAMYRAAEKIVGLDGSAFHLLGFVGHKDQTVGIILRRNSNVFRGLHNQIIQFTGAEPVVMNVVLADWIPEHRKRPGRYSFGQLDFKALAEQLQTAGLIEPSNDWAVPRFRDVKQAMAKFGARKGIAYVRVKKSAKRRKSKAA